MVKRVMWMGTGFACGVGVTLWADYKVRRAVGRLTPGSVGQQAVDRARGAGGSLRAALTDGRAAMRDREGELRRQLLDSARPPADAPPGEPARLRLVAGAEAGPRS